MKLAAVLLALTFVTMAFAQTPPSGVIAGVVKRSDNGEEVAGVRVTLGKWASSQPTGPRDYERRTPPPVDPLVITDADGKFRFAALEAGTYKLTVAANGFVRQEYGQNAPIELAAGKVVDNVAVRLTPAGSVRGRVRNADKEPAAVVVVRLFRFGYDGDGRKTRQYVAATQTDDRGEFRLHYVTPGRYYVAVGSAPGAQRVSGVNGIAGTDPITYYPGVTDPAQAAAIDVPPGAEIDLELSQARQPGYRVRGRVVDSRTGRPPSSVTIVLTSRGAGGGSYEVSSEAMSYNASTGDYELHGILPGTYRVTATWGDSIAVHRAFMPSPPPRGDPSEFDAVEIIKAGVAYATLTIADADVDSLPLTIVAGGAIAGRMRVDGGSAPMALNLAKAHIYLKPALDGAPADTANNYSPNPVEISADGTFRFDNVRVGEYRVTVGALDSAFYMKEARSGANDALNHSFTFTTSESNVLDLVIGYGPPEISGTVRGERLDLVPGSQVVLVPERNRDRVELFRTATAGPDGRFTITNVVPGDYKVFAWEVLEPYAYFDPDLLRRDDAKGRPIHVEESANQNVDLRVIRATP